MLGLKDWRGDVSLFPSERQTIPEAMHVGLGWDELCEVLAPRALVRERKSSLRYFLPCLLDESRPYTGKTAQRFPPDACGPMRSREHVLQQQATWLVLDLDDCVRAEVAGYLRGLRDERITFLAYTTYSNGAPGKSGYRMRVVVPVDEPLTLARYKAAHRALNGKAFGGRADTTGESLCQQQSVWGCSPDLADGARRGRNDSGVLQVATLPMEAPKTAPVRPSVAGANRSDLPSAQRIERAMAWLVADEGYADWAKVLMALAALRHHLGDEATEYMAQRYHQTAPPDSTRALRCDLPQYDPTAVIQKTPTMPAQAAVGCLLGRARDKAREAVLDGMRGRHSDRERFNRAAVYLAEFHRSTYIALQNDATEGPLDARP